MKRDPLWMPAQRDAYRRGQEAYRAGQAFDWNNDNEPFLATWQIGYLDARDANRMHHPTTTPLIEI